jgi:hypothetical protein
VNEGLVACSAAESLLTRSVAWESWRMGYRRAHFEKREEKLNGTCRDQLISNHPRYSIQIVYKNVW